DRLRTVTFSRVAATHRLAAWVRLLALAAAHPGRRFEAVTVGRGEDGVAVARIPPVPPAEALAELAALAALYAEGMREPLPLFCKTSAAFAQHGAQAAAGEWTSGWSFAREDQDAEHRLVLGGVVAFEALDPRFAQFARRLWDPLLAREQA
ncbi:MAG TPA: hypothetical protein VH418_21285, partial [Solirubrobacteraceae bacterium]